MRNSLRLYSWLLVLLCLSMGSCEEERIPVDSISLERIYPVTIGDTRYYHVLDSSFDVSGAIVEEYIRREEVVGTTTDLLGRTVYQIQVQRAKLGSDDFRASHRWNLYIPPEEEANSFIERNEDNVRNLVLAYPMNPVVTWDGNRFNPLETRIFSYLSTDTTVTIGTKEYEGSIFVQEGEEQRSAIRFGEAFSIYRPGFGHLFRYHKVMVFDGPNREFNPDESRIYREEILTD
ncbi:MAG: hypothetical protein AAF694_02460 [Bacteroidota bacterium]